MLQADSCPDIAYIQVVHRADLQSGIIRACNEYPDAIHFKLAHTVLNVEYARAGQPTRFLIRRPARSGQGGEKEDLWLEADVVVGADGIRSVARRDMLRLRGEGDHSENMPITFPST